jgi:gentisate 1,2-dioxygenase
VFHVIEGGMRADIDSAAFTLGEADTCCAPGYTAVTLINNHNAPTFVFMADETPLHQKLGVYENRG